MRQMLKAPFPWFGGKSRVAPIVWERFGAPDNYVEPFAGSLAVLFGRPSEPGTETVNDMDCYLANFWRAVKSDPFGVAEYADWPVNEADLEARHQWLVDQAPFRERVKADPEYFDARIAGWWVWGICSWIGGHWCDSAKYRDGNAGQGVNRQLPHLGNAGRGVNRKLPHLGNAGRGVNRKLPLHDWMHRLSARLRRVRVACGDWSRVMGESVTVKHGMTAVFLDPPYASERSDVYAHDSFDVAHDVREWAIANGDNPLLRIALCGYEGEHAMPDSWECVAWKTAGGYGSQAAGTGLANASRERIWFSPHCLRLQGSLWEGS